MIESANQHAIASEQLIELNARLGKLQEESPGKLKGYTKAGIRKMIAKIHEDLAIYEATNDPT